jgi:hypothetical protein
VELRPTSIVKAATAPALSVAFAILAPSTALPLSAVLSNAHALSLQLMLRLIFDAAHFKDASHYCCQATEARRAIVAALACQWFGVFMRPRAPADAWLLAGLAGWLEGQFVRTFQGANELAYRCRKQIESTTPLPMLKCREIIRLIQAVQQADRWLPPACAQLRC